jgi:hypothetical protein
MKTLTIEITGNEAMTKLKSMEEKNLIRILSGRSLDLYALPGEPVSDEDFKKWVEYAENIETVPLNEARQRWENQKTKLQQFTH